MDIENSSSTSAPPLHSPRTPPRKRYRDIPSTPLKTNSDSLRSSFTNGSTSRYTSTTRSELDPVLNHELHNTVERDIPGLLHTFFPLTNAIEQVYQQCSELGYYDEARRQWVKYPSPANEDQVLAWFDIVAGWDMLKFYSSLVTGAVYGFRASGQKSLQAGDCKRKCDLFLTAAVRCDKDRKNLTASNWAEVRVVGEIKSNETLLDCLGTFIQTSNYVREVFGAQPNRRYVHGFVLCGSKMRAWIFDRAGAIGSTVIDIHADPLDFLRVMYGYINMDAAAIGFEESIAWELPETRTIFDSSEYNACLSSNQTDIPLPYIEPDASTNLPAQLELDPKHIISRVSIVTRGTVCYKARDRGSLDWLYCVKYQFRAKQRHPEGQILKDAKIIASTPGLPTYFESKDIYDGVGNPVSVSSIRRGLSNNRESTTSAALKKSTDYNYKNTSYTRGPLILHDRILTRSIISPLGMPLCQFYSEYQSGPTVQQSINLLKCFLDALNGHRTLWNAGVLHRDISSSNILLLNNSKASHGMLIDLDLAVLKDRDTNSGAPHRTVGTMQFLSHTLSHPAVVHSARHDVESFFWSFLHVLQFTHVANPAPTWAFTRKMDTHALAFRSWSLQLETDLEEKILQDFPDKHARFLEVLVEWAIIVICSWEKVNVMPSTDKDSKFSKGSILEEGTTRDPSSNKSTVGKSFAPYQNVSIQKPEQKPSVQRSVVHWKYSDDWVYDQVISCLKIGVEQFEQSMQESMEEATQKLRG